MTFDNREQSLNEGQPFELYKFNANGSQFYYTTLPYDVVFQGITYVSQSIDRSAIRLSSGYNTESSMDVYLPVDNPIVSIYTKQNPSLSLDVEIFRSHVGLDFDTNFERDWLGTAISFEIKNFQMTVRTISTIGVKLSGPSRAASFTYGCNNRVYDERCKLNEDDFSYEVPVYSAAFGRVGTSLNSFALDGILIPNLPLPITQWDGATVRNTVVQPDDQFGRPAGLGLLPAAQRLGFEETTITALIAADFPQPLSALNIQRLNEYWAEFGTGPTPTWEGVYRLQFPAGSSANVSFARGDTVKIILSCNNTEAVCKNRFNNYINYNGFQYIPNQNPFRAGVT